MNWPRKILKLLPIVPAPWIASGIRSACASQLVLKSLRRRQERALQGVGGLEKVLIIADVNIGDAINIQPALDVIRDLLPDCHVDLAHSATAGPLVEHNPAISRNIPVFDGRFVPDEREAREIQRLAREGGYDLVLSFCPFLRHSALENAACPVITPLRLICEIIARACRDDGMPAGIGRNLGRYVREIVEMTGAAETPTGNGEVPRARMYLPGQVLRRRNEWLESRGIRQRSKSVMFNPDASNVYTRLDREIQLKILTRILSSDRCRRLFIGSGFTFEGIEQVLLERLPPGLREKVEVVPRELPIEIYAALLDDCDVFISADTGPLHIAAARKVCVSGESAFRNRTSVIGLFGPTIGCIYGYDSGREGYTAANQDAPSRTFEARCQDKNLACSLARITEQCDGGRCFENFSAPEVADFALERLACSETELTARKEV